MSAVAAVRVRVPAKVNLLLSVGPRRADGFHDLETVFHAVDLTDEVVARPAVGLSVVMTGDGTDGLPEGPGNLIWQAASRLAEALGIAPGVRLELHKQIPVAGGMAGGSADAAATLVACAALWGADVDLQPLAAGLGSDVAFTLLGGTALGRGRGEILTPVPDGPALHWAFALADTGISTADAYAELDRRRDAGTVPAPIAGPAAMLAALAAGDVAAVAAALANDLQPIALARHPGLHDTLAAGLAAGALGGVVSGSGPTCAFLCPDAAAARRTADALDAAGTCRATRVASGPAPGARVVA